VAALHPLLHAGQATLAAAKIGTALFGAGYASDANFTTGFGRAARFRPFCETQRASR
jgi:hypothetical protein